MAVVSSSCRRTLWPSLHFVVVLFVPAAILSAFPDHFVAGRPVLTVLITGSPRPDRYPTSSSVLLRYYLSVFLTAVFLRRRLSGPLLYLTVLGKKALETLRYLI